MLQYNFKGFSLQDAHHEKTDLKVLVVVIPTFQNLTLLTS